MFGIIMAVGFIIAGVVIGVVNKNRFGVGCVIGGFIIGIACILLASFASVPTGYTGIVTSFGKVENITLDAGIHAKAPWKDVITMDNRVQKQTIDLSCFSSDIQEVSVKYTLNYQIDKQNAMTIYKTIGKNYYSTAIEPNVAEAVKTVVARYTAENLIESRAELASAIESYLTEILSKYNIQVVSTAIEDMDFSDVFTNAVEQKQVAAQNRLQAEIEQEQKNMEQEATAKRAVIEAEAAAEVAKIQAQADLEVVKIQADAAEYAGLKEAAKNKAVADALTDDLIEYYYIQQWDGKLPTYMGGESTVPVLDLRD